MSSSKMNSEIHKRRISNHTVLELWAKSAGRCAICNKKLYIDSALGVEGNYAEKAHIHAVSENGPRHKKDITNAELSSSNNLMLLCAEHHKLIDTQPDNYGEGLLLKFKKMHEDRIEAIASQPNFESSRMVSFFSRVGNFTISHQDNVFKEALRSYNLLPKTYPVIELHDGMSTSYVPSKAEFISKANELEKNFKSYFADIVNKTEKVAVFALAPQCLLIKLGSLLDDQFNVDVFQHHRSGHYWAWKDSCDEYKLQIIKPEDKEYPQVALVIDLSAEVVNERITSVLGENTGIYHITLDNPDRNFVKTPEVQVEFVKAFREAMEMIKNSKASPSVINLFPVMPNSLAVKLGMDFMPKADIPLLVYEQANAEDGFFSTIHIGGEDVYKR